MISETHEVTDVSWYCVKCQHQAGPAEWPKEYESSPDCLRITCPTCSFSWRAHCADWHKANRDHERLMALEAAQAQENT